MHTFVRHILIYLFTFSDPKPQPSRKRGNVTLDIIKMSDMELDEINAALSTENDFEYLSEDDQDDREDEEDRNAVAENVDIHIHPSQIDHDDEFDNDIGNACSFETIVMTGPPVSSGSGDNILYNIEYIVGEK